MELYLPVIIEIHDRGLLLILVSADQKACGRIILSRLQDPFSCGNLAGLAGMPARL